VPFDAVEPPGIPQETVAVRLTRALTLAQHPSAGISLAAEAAFSSRMVLRFERPGAGEASVATELRLVTEHAEPEDWLYLGTLAERIRVAAWSEDLDVEIAATADPSPTLHLTATPII
jgi:hypothetical protein